MGLRALGALLGAVVGWACAIEPFHCIDDQQCVENGVTGQCQANQYCTFPDDACPSGQRYAESAGGGLGGTCLPVDESMGTESADGDGDEGGDAGTGDGTGDGSDDSRLGDGSTGDSSSGAGGSDAGGSDSGGPSSSGPGDSTVGVGDTTGDDTTSGGSSTTSEIGEGGLSTDDGPMPPPDSYDPCPDAACPNPGEVCLEPDLEEVCAPPCRSDDDCPAAPGAANPPVCTPLGAIIPGVCVIPCNTNNDCPDAMDCTEDDIGLQIGGELCAWD